ncbi:DUF3486 family protein [Nitrosomonas aestuarii]|nr:DUF3486 family protein [Nitrosomonas aestuarii]
MARQSKIDALPAEIKEWLDNSLADGNFSGYQLLSDELKLRGYDISHASVHRYGQKIEKRMAAIRAATEAAQILARNTPDQSDELSASVIRMAQSELFDVMVDLQEAEAENDPAKRVKLLSRAALAISNLARAKVIHRKWQDEARERTEKAASAAEKIARKGGLSAESVDQLRREILGIVE